MTGGTYCPKCGALHPFNAAAPHRCGVPPEVLPPMPENIRLLLKDGTVLAVDSVYEGLDEDGVHMWAVQVPATVLAQVRRLMVDALPGHTGLRVTLLVTPEE